MSWNRHSGAALAAMSFVVLGLAAPTAGQRAPDSGVWTAVSLRGQLGGDPVWRWTAGAIAQSTDGVRRFDLGFGHVMLTRELGRGVEIGFGYAAGAGLRNSGVLLEHRLTQLFGWSRGVRARVSLKSLFEERFITGRDNLLLRTRLQLRMTWPFAAGHRLQVVASGEMLLQTDSRAPASPHLDGTRFFAGVGWKLTRASALEIGYLNARSRGGGKDPSTSHVLSASLAVSLSEGRRR